MTIGSTTPLPGGPTSLAGLRRRGEQAPGVASALRGGDPRRKASPRRFAERMARLRDRHTRLIAAGLVGLATYGALHELRPAPAPTATVLVVTRAVASGTTLTAQDVRTQAVPVPLVPGEAIVVAADAVGYRTTVALTAGQPLTGPLLTPARSLPPGQVALPVPLTATEAAWLHPGDRLMLAAGTSTGTESAAKDGVNRGSTFTATALAVSGSNAQTSAFTPATAASALLQVRSQDVNEIAQAARNGVLAVSLMP